jgi:hypothetical protein
MKVTLGNCSSIPVQYQLVMSVIVDDQDSNGSNVLVIWVGRIRPFQTQYEGVGDPNERPLGLPASGKEGGDFAG